MKETANQLVTGLVNIIRRQHVGLPVHQQISCLINLSSEQAVINQEELEILIRVRGEELLNMISAMGQETLRPPEGHIIHKSLYQESIENQER